MKVKLMTKLSSYVMLLMISQLSFGFDFLTPTYQIENVSQGVVHRLNTSTGEVELCRLGKGCESLTVKASCDISEKGIANLNSIINKKTWNDDAIRKAPILQKIWDAYYRWFTFTTFERYCNYLNGVDDLKKIN